MSPPLAHPSPIFHYGYEAHAAALKVSPLRVHASAVVELARVSRLHITFVTVAHRDNCSRSPAYRFGVVTSPPCLEKTCLMALVARLSGLTLAPHVRILVSRHQSTWILSVEHHLDGKMPWVSSGTHSHGPWRTD